MPEVIAAVIGIIVGGVVVALVMHFRSRTLVQEKAAELESRASGAEGTVIELRNQVNGALADLQSVRAQLDDEGKNRVAAETRLAAAQTSLDEQRATLDTAKKALTDAFQALAAEALKGNREEFAALAHERVDKLIDPLKGALDRYETQIRDIESKRVDAYSRLSANLTELSNASAGLQQQTTKLEQALRAPGIRGRWGELMLEKVLELSGLSRPVIDSQATIATEDGPVRPDVIVHLPGNRSIIVDSKAPMDAYMDAMAAEKLETRKQKLSEHAAAVRGHMRRLAQKDYAKQVQTSADMVVMFLPGESVLAAALDADKDLLKDSMQYRVALATPTTLILALHTVAHTWQQHELEKNAEEIARAGSQLYERLCVFVEHLKEIREGIEKAAKSYAKVVRSWQERVEPGARKLKELGAAKGDKEIPELDASEPFLPPPPGTENPAE